MSRWVAIAGVVLSTVVVAASSRAAAGPGLVAVVGDLRPSLVPRVYAADTRTGTRMSVQALEGTRDDVLSPDRGQIAFVGSREGYDAVYVAGSDGADIRRLTPQITTTGFFGGTCSASESNPVWSPDGQRLVFEISFGMLCNSPSAIVQSSLRHVASARYTSAVPHQLVLVNSDGSGLHLLGIDGFSPSWSPDSSHLAYITRSDRSLQAIPGTSSAVAALTDAKPHLLGTGTTPIWSPNGRLLALSSGGKIGIFDTAGRLIRRVPGRRAAWTACGLAVSRDGVAVSADRRRVAVGEKGRIVVHDCGRPPHVWVRGSYQPVSFAPNARWLLIRRCDGARCNLGVASASRLEPLGRGTDAAWAPVGDSLCFLGPRGAIVLARATSGTTKTLAREGADQLLSPPAWRDAQTVVYWTVAAAPEADLYTLAPDTGRTRRLARNVDSGAGATAWSPDGSTLAYSTAAGLSLVNVASGVSRLLTAEPALLPSWSPDGSQIAFGTPAGLDVSDITGSRSRIVAPATSATITAVQWSPTGDWIAYNAGGLRLVRPDGTDDHLFASDAVVFTWARDGSSLYYRGSDAAWKRRDIEGGNLTELPTAVQLVVSPDGTQIAYEQEQLFVGNADGQAARQIGGNPTDTLLSWGVGGILVLRSPGHQLFSVTPDDSHATPLTPDWAIVAWAGWSQ